MPFYKTGTTQQIGIYTDSGTRYGVEDDSECVAVGAFSFGVPNNSSLYENQINVA